MLWCVVPCMSCSALVFLVKVCACYARGMWPHCFTVGPACCGVRIVESLDLCSDVVVWVALMVFGVCMLFFARRSSILTKYVVLGGLSCMVFTKCGLSLPFERNEKSK